MSERSLLAELQSMRVPHDENRNDTRDMYLGDIIELDIEVPFPFSVLVNFDARKK